MLACKVHSLDITVDSVHRYSDIGDLTFGTVDNNMRISAAFELELGDMILDQGHDLTLVHEKK